MREFAVNLETDSKIPLYEQIYNAIRDAILEGRITKEEKLPSTRSEAEYLSCSRSTVELAYDQLLAEGYIKSQPCRGYFACDVGNLYHLEDSSRKEQNTIIDEQKEESGYSIDFSPNGIELEAFPFSVLGKIMKNVVLYDGEKVLKRSNSMGDPDLRKAIAEYLFRSRNVMCDPDQIIIGAGNEYLQNMLAQMLGPDHVVAMESPTYLSAYHTFRNLGYPVEEIEMDSDGMRVDLLERSHADLVYVMPSHQFPLGTVMPLQRRLELLNWAIGDSNRYIIEDDYDSEFRYRGKPIPALQGIDHAEKVIYLGTFSRSIAPAVRISYMVLPEHMLHLYKKVCGFYSCTVSGFMQHTVVHFIKEGHFEKNLNRMRGIYRAKHDLLIAELKRSSCVKRIIGDHAGLHVAVEVRSHRSEAEIIESCKKMGVRVYGISEYFIGKTSGFHNPVLLIGYGGLSDIQIRKGIEILCRSCETDDPF